MYHFLTKIGMKHSIYRGVDPVLMYLGIIFACLVCYGLISISTSWILSLLLAVATLAQVSCMCLDLYYRHLEGSARHD